jgi:hypothetical protein
VAVTEYVPTHVPPVDRREAALRAARRQTSDGEPIVEWVVDAVLRVVDDLTPDPTVLAKHLTVKSLREYADETHRHIGGFTCLPEHGDRCDITAALRALAVRVETSIP